MEMCKIFVFLFVEYLQGANASTSRNAESSECVVPRASSIGDWRHNVREKEWELKNDYCRIVFQGLDRVVRSLTEDAKSVLEFPNGCPNPKDSDERGSFRAKDVTGVTATVDKKKQGSVRLLCSYGERKLQYSTSSETVVNPLKYKRCILGAVNDFISADMIAEGLPASVARKYCHELGRMEARFHDSLKFAALFSSVEEARKYWDVPKEWSLLMSRFEAGKGYMAMFDQGLLVVPLPVKTRLGITQAFVFQFHFGQELKTLGIEQASDQTNILKTFLKEKDLLTHLLRSSASPVDAKIMTDHASVGIADVFYKRVSCYSRNGLIARADLPPFALEIVEQSEKVQLKVPSVSWFKDFSVDVYPSPDQSTDIKIISFYVCQDLEGQTTILKRILEKVSAKFLPSKNGKKLAPNQRGKIKPFAA